MVECEMCGVIAEPRHFNKLLSKLYCDNCISKARSERRKQLASRPAEKRKRSSASKERAEEARIRKRLKESKENSLKVVKDHYAEIGIEPLVVEEMPIRLRRNERVYFLGGNTKQRVFSISLALTNQRLFAIDPGLPLIGYKGKSQRLGVTAGIKGIQLSSVLAIDHPATNKKLSAWTTRIHTSPGQLMELCFNTCLAACQFHVLVAEMVDRVNDPIDEAAFSPTRERISDEAKMAVWRRDGGQCVRCGSRHNLEYDHIIPVSKGGSSTVRNLELLCETCNRSKSAKIM